MRATSWVQIVKAGLLMLGTLLSKEKSSSTKFDEVLVKANTGL